MYVRVRSLLETTAITTTTAAKKKKNAFKTTRDSLVVCCVTDHVTGSPAQTVAAAEDGAHPAEALRNLAAAVNRPQEGRVAIATQRLDKALARCQTLCHTSSPHSRKPE